MALPAPNDIPLVGGIFKYLQSNGMDYGLHVTAVIFVTLYIAFSSSPTLAGSTFSFFFALTPIWLPLMVFRFFFMRWMDFVGKSFWLNTGRVTYRLILPQEVYKSPEAMEFVINQMWNKQSADNLWQTYIDGKRPLPVGLEIVSIGGDVRFYVNLPAKKTKESFLSTIYSQYPGIEVIEEPVDYAAEIPLGDPEWDVMSIHMNKKEKKWAPIKTYIDYGLDKMPKEEEKLDPLTPLLERLGDISPNERIYVQFVITAFRQSSFSNGQLMLGESPDWTAEGQAHIDELMQRDPETKAPRTKEGTDFDGAPRITPGERGTIEAIERNLEKYAFWGGGRFIYAAKKGHFNGNLINPIIRVFSQFDVVGRGGLGVKWRTDFDYMWFSDPFGDRVKAMKLMEHKEFKLRRFYQKSQNDDEKLFTTEELATLFHLPGKVAGTPTLGRISSARSQAPSNLPVGDFPNL